MSEWTLGQWVAYAIVWLWGTWASGKVSNFLQRGFEARILAIHPYYKFPNRYRTIPGWLVGSVCVWLVDATVDSELSKIFIHFDIELMFFVVYLCFLSIFPVIFITYFGWMLPNQFGIVRTVFDAAVLRGKSLKPHD
jgi:hypothetical protein